MWTVKGFYHALLPKTDYRAKGREHDHRLAIIMFRVPINWFNICACIYLPKIWIANKLPNCILQIVPIVLYFRCTHCLLIQILGFVNWVNCILQITPIMSYLRHIIILVCNMIFIFFNVHMFNLYIDGSIYNNFRIPCYLSERLN